MKLCSLYSGSSGNCIYVGNDRTHLLVDAGVSGTKVVSALWHIGITPNQLDGILVTHEHTDHIQGVGVLSRKYDLPIYATEKTWLAMEKKVGQVSIKNMRQIQAGMDFYIHDVDISPTSIPHDAVDPVCYHFMHQGKKVGVCTDLGYMPKSVYDTICDCDALLLEANHDLDMLNAGSYPFELKRRISGKLGHLSNETCANTLVRLAGRVRQVLLGHLSQENNTEDVALSTIQSILMENGISAKDMGVAVLKRQQHSPIYLV